MSTLRRVLPLAAFRPGVLSRLFGHLLAAEALARSRRSLERLDDHMLRDIGLTRAEAEEEAKRTLWDSPSHWKA